MYTFLQEKQMAKDSLTWVQGGKQRGWTRILTCGLLR